MIISKLCGGLGNQMFQYAAARAVAIDRRQPVLVDTSWFDIEHGGTYRVYELGIFSADIPIAEASLVASLQPSVAANLLQRAVRKGFSLQLNLSRSYVREPHYHYWTKLGEVPSPCLLDGYWQSPKYFEKHAQAIREDFSFPLIEGEENQAVLDSIRNSENPVSIHIRRGDYVSDSKTNATHGCCSPAYYSTAISHMESSLVNPSYYFFSDDPEWVKENFSLKNMVVVQGNMDETAFRDMQLMSECKHHVIANSSFSWWGAWLSEHQGMTIAPKQWFQDASFNTKDVYCDEWIRI